VIKKPKPQSPIENWINRLESFNEALFRLFQHIVPIVALGMGIIAFLFTFAGSKQFVSELSVAIEWTKDGGHEKPE
jgi:hypothetical protein